MILFPHTELLIGLRTEVGRWFVVDVIGEEETGLGVGWVAGVRVGFVTGVVVRVVSILHKLLDGTAIANDWQDLLDSELLSAIKLNEFGQLTSGNAWTSTYDNGDLLTENCNSWTSASSSVLARYGNSKSMYGSWTSANYYSCNNKLKLYCFEQN